MKATIYREPNRFKRWWSRRTETWRYDRYMPGLAPFRVHRLRYWPADAVLIGLAVWLGHNLFLIMWYMLSAIQGRTVSFNPEGWWYWPLRTFFQIF